jgi:hypothetical protein
VLVLVRLLLLLMVVLQQQLRRRRHGLLLLPPPALLLLLLPPLAQRLALPGGRRLHLRLRPGCSSRGHLGLNLGPIQLQQLQVRLDLQEEANEGGGACGGGGSGSGASGKQYGALGAAHTPGRWRAAEDCAPAAAPAAHSCPCCAAR